MTVMKNLMIWWSQNNTFSQNTSQTQIISRTDICNTLYNKNDSSEEEKNTIYTKPDLLLSESSVKVSEDNNTKTQNSARNLTVTSEAIKPTAILSTSSLHSPQPSVLDRCPPYQEEHLQSKNCYWQPKYKTQSPILLQPFTLCHPLTFPKQPINHLPSKWKEVTVWSLLPQYHHGSHQTALGHLFLPLNWMFLNNQWEQDQTLWTFLKYVLWHIFKLVRAECVRCPWLLA